MDRLLRFIARTSIEIFNTKHFKGKLTLKAFILFFFIGFLLYFIIMKALIFFNEKRLIILSTDFLNLDRFIAYIIQPNISFIYSFLILSFIFIAIIIYYGDFSKSEKKQSIIFGFIDNEEGVDFNDIAKIWVGERIKVNYEKKEFKYIIITTNYVMLKHFINGTIIPLMQKKKINYQDTLIIKALIEAFSNSKAGSIPSVVNNQENYKNSKNNLGKGIKSDYDIFANVSLLEHSLNVVYNLLKEEKQISNLGVAIICGLTHDLGKIPKSNLELIFPYAVMKELDSSLKNSHDIIGSILLKYILNEFREIDFNFNTYKDYEEIEYVINNHHNLSFDTEHKFYNTLKIVVDADRKARADEKTKYIEKPYELKDFEINNTLALGISIPNLDSIKNITNDENINDNLKSSLEILNNLSIQENELEYEKISITNEPIKEEPISVLTNSLADKLKELGEFNNKQKLVVLKDFNDLNSLSFNYFTCDDFNNLAFYIETSSINKNILIEKLKEKSKQILVFKLINYKDDLKQLKEDIKNTLDSVDLNFYEFKKESDKKEYYKENNLLYLEFDIDFYKNRILKLLNNGINNNNPLNQDDIYSIYNHQDGVIVFNYDFIISCVREVLLNDKDIENNYTLYANYFIKNLAENGNVKFINAKQYFFTIYQLLKNDIVIKEIKAVPILPKAFNKKSNSVNTEFKNNNLQFFKVKRRTTNEA